MRNRSVVFVIRDKKILMEKLCYEGRTFYSIPGGGIEDGENPEQTAIRELKEECGLDGVIIKKLAEVYNAERTEYSFWVSVPKEQEAVKGYDPEEPMDDQSIKEVLWMSLDEMSEKDRAFMWRYGLLEIPEFIEEVLSWGDTISYPSKESDECIVTKSDWDIMPMPRKNKKFKISRKFSGEDIKRLKKGHIPNEMEDKWFYYYEDGKAYFHRSWSGFCIYIVEFDFENDKHTVTVNRDKKQYSNTDIKEDIRMIDYLLN